MPDLPGEDEDKDMNEAAAVPFRWLTKRLGRKSLKQIINQQEFNNKIKGANKPLLLGVIQEIKENDASFDMDVKEDSDRVVLTLTFDIKDLDSSIIQKIRQMFKVHNRDSYGDSEEEKNANK